MARLAGDHRLLRYPDGRLRYERGGYRDAIDSTWYTPRGGVARELFTVFGRTWTYSRYVFDADGYIVGQWIGFGPSGLAAYRARQYRAVTDWRRRVAASRRATSAEQTQDASAAYQQLALFEARAGARAGG